MFFRPYRVLFISLFFLQQVSHLLASDVLIEAAPVIVFCNPGPRYSLINSVDFHPQRNLFCATYTHDNRVVLCEIDAAGTPKVVQTLKNPLASLSEPQHAVFSPDGEKIIVANWTNQTLTIYECSIDGSYCATPAAVIAPPSQLIPHKPHGVACSPCGNFLAIAYGAASYHGRAIALFRMAREGIGCELVSVLQGPESLPGIPKGITFSPDGTCLLVTFSDVNSLVIFDLIKNGTIFPVPRQVIQGRETRISRPEDVKISPDGDYCVVSNSDQNTVTFYPFNKNSNWITQSTPIYVLQNPEARLCFPHGIAFSPDGSFVTITEFGPINTTKDGDIVWDTTLRPDQATINIYKIVSNK